MPPPPILRKLPVTLRPNPARVLIRPFWPANEPRAHSPIHAPRAMTIIMRVLAPLLRPAPEEREGYVPNVVYTCGGLVHRGHLLLPYATSDWYTSFATIKVSELLQAMSPA